MCAINQAARRQGMLALFWIELLQLFEKTGIAYMKLSLEGMFSE